MVLRIVADATPEIGAGHVMRCSVLAEAWIRLGFGSAIVSGRITIPFVAECLSELRIEVASKPKTLNGSSVTVVDSYDPRVRETLSTVGSGLRVLVDDDGGYAPQSYHVVWNPNPYGAPSLYPEYRGIVLAGLEAIPIRSNLPAWKGRGNTNRIALALGGGTPHGAIVESCRLLDKRGYELRPVGNWLGQSYGKSIPPSEAWRGISKCESLVTGCGSTVLEAAAVGIPLVGIVLAPNQVRISHWMGQFGVPVISYSPTRSPNELCELIAESIPRAKALPRLESGAVGVAETLYKLQADPSLLRRYAEDQPSSIDRIAPFNET